MHLGIWMQPFHHRSAPKPISQGYLIISFSQQLWNSDLKLWSEIWFFKKFRQLADILWLEFMPFYAQTFEKQLYRNFQNDFWNSMTFHLKSADKNTFLRYDNWPGHSWYRLWFILFETRSDFRETTFLQAQAISFLQSMSEMVGSDIERLWISFRSYSIDLVSMGIRLLW